MHIVIGAASSKGPVWNMYKGQCTLAWRRDQVHSPSLSAHDYHHHHIILMWTVSITDVTQCDAVSFPRFKCLEYSGACRRMKEGGSTNPHAYDQIQRLLKIPQDVLPNAFRRFYNSEKIQVSGRNRTYNLWGTSPLL